MKSVEKPWGRELWIAHTDKYALKIIWINQGTRSSLQYHNMKHEHIYVESGILRVEKGPDKDHLTEIFVKAGEVIENKPGELHRSSAVEDVKLIEVSTPELDDVVRVEDDFGRQGTSHV